MRQPELLLVEDNPEMATAVALVLEREGYRVQHTPSGLEAIMRVSREPFELVLLDMQIEEVSGAGVLRVISDLAIRTPVFAMSAQARGWQNDAFRHGASACLRKPFDMRRLLELIAAFRQSTMHAGWPGDVRRLSAEDLDALARMSREQLDALPFGAIRLDAERRIDRFNRFEADAATFFPASVVGMRFSELAPCSAVKEFAETIEQGYATGEVDRVLRFVFPHHGARAVVSVRVFCDRDTHGLWIFVSKVRGELAVALSPELSDDALGDALPS
jgi:photoactive yellow protein